MQDLHQGWGENLHRELRSRKMSQRTLADLCNVHESTISRVINGEVCPHDELKWKIAGALGLRMDQLWAWPMIIPPRPDRQAA